jgi:hypothetical protein
VVSRRLDQPPDEFISGEPTIEKQGDAAFVIGNDFGGGRFAPALF